MRLFICSDVRIFREGLAETLAIRDGLEIVGTACGGQECLQSAQALAPDVVLLDMATAGSADLLTSLLLAGVDAYFHTRRGRGAVERSTRASVSNRDSGVPLPTHAQIAKDAPDHPLFVASMRLVREADVEIGRAMIAAWTSSGTAEQRRAIVEPHVDRFIAHPQATHWWRPILHSAADQAAARSRRQPVPAAQSRHAAP